MEHRPQPAHRQPSRTAASTRASTPTEYRPIGTDLRGRPPGPQAGAARVAAPRRPPPYTPRQQRYSTTRRSTSVTNLPSPSSQQPVPGACTGSLPGVACWPRPANRRKVSDGASTPTGSAWPHPSSSGCPARSWRLRVCRREEPDGCLRGKRRPGRSPPWRGGCSSSMRPSARQPSRRSSERRRRARGAKGWPSGMSRRTATRGDG